LSSLLQIPLSMIKYSDVSALMRRDIMKFSKLTDRIAELGSDKWALHMEARKLKERNKDIIELTIGEPDQPPADILIQKCHESMLSGRTKYSNGRGEPNLLEALASKYSKRSAKNISPKNFLCLPGTQTALYATMMTLVEEKDGVLVGDPYYATYEGIIRSSGAEIQPIPLHEEFGFSIQEQDIRKQIKPSSKILLLNSPHNPSGAVLSKEDILKLVDVCEEHDLWLVSDEVYEDLIFEQAFASPLEIERLVNRTIVVSSISKSHAAPGFRSGWVLAPEEVIEKMLPLTETMLFGNQPFIADMTEYALRTPSEAAFKMKTDYERRAKLICKSLANIEGIEPLMPKSGMFILLRINQKNSNADEFAWSLLREQSVATMPGSSFGKNGKNYLRLSLTVPDKMLQEACDRIKTFIK
jgi:arginine:pyruvate transaminase